MIWDLHVHLSGVEGATPEDRLARMIAIADRLGIERLCVYLGLAFTEDPSPETFRRDNDQVLQAIGKFPDRAFGFVYLNPKHVEASLAELERCVANGPMVGVKLWVAHRCSAPELDPIVKRAAELKAVIYQHTWFNATGNLPGESTPDDLAQLAARHPEATLICGHTGGDWERGLRAIRHLRNVYSDLAGSDPVAGYTLEAPAFACLLELATARQLLVQIACSLEDERTQHPRLPVPPVDISPLIGLLERTPATRVLLINAFRTLRGQPVLDLATRGVRFEIATLEGVEGIARLVTQIPGDCLCFGSHAPFFYFESAKLKLRESALSEAQMKAVCSENARHLLARA